MHDLDWLRAALDGDLLERDGLLTREVFAEVPPRVEYALTGLGLSLTGPIAVLGDWAEAHIDRITAAQASYDAA